MEDIQKVAVVGLGAVGAAMTAQFEANAPDVELCALVRNVERRKRNPIFVNEIPLKVRCCGPEELAAQKPELILLTTKSYQLSQAIEEMRDAVGPDTQILSLLNGVLSEEALCAAFGEEHILYATLVEADTNRAENRVHCNCVGKILFGERSKAEKTERVARVERLLLAARIPCQVMPDMELALWEKLLVNAGCNQVTTAYQLTYGQLRKNRWAMRLVRNAQEEIVALANARGIPLQRDSIDRWEKTLEGLSENGRSSMLQDFWRGRQLETDILGEYVCAQGKALQVSVPVNTLLRDRIKEMVRMRDYGIKSKEHEESEICPPQENMAAPDKIAHALRIDILHQKYKTGEKLAENQLAQQFGASRSSVRTALQTLSSEGLIITNPNGRREVARFSMQQVQDLYEFRWMLENRALELVLNRKKTIYPQMVEILSHIESCCEQDYRKVDWYDLDVCFHRALVASADNMFLSNAWESNAPIIYTLMSFNTTKGYGQEYAETFFAKHKKLYELMLAGDESCYRVLQEHILEAEDIANAVMVCCRDGHDLRQE